jgi:hypothetical protein
MTDRYSAAERPIGFDGENVLLETADEDLLNLMSPAPVDVVADQAWDYLGRFQQRRAELIADLENLDVNELSAATRRPEFISQLGTMVRSIARLEVLCRDVGTVSLQVWLHEQETL